MSRRAPYRITNIVAVIVAALVVMAVGVGFFLTRPAASNTASVRVTLDEVAALTLPEAERVQLMTEAGITITQPAVDPSSAVLLDASPESCDRTTREPIRLGSYTTGTASTSNAAVSLESSVMLFETPGDARDYLEWLAESRTDSCKSYSYSAVTTHLRISSDYFDAESELDDSSVLTPRLRYDQTLTYSDGFQAHGRMEYRLVGNAVVLTYYVVNQPLTRPDAPWGDVAFQKSGERVDAFVAAATSNPGKP